MQTGKRISSPDTFFLRRVFPVIWLGLLALGLIQVYFMKLEPHQSPTLIFVVLLGLAVFGYFVMRATLSGLVNEVYDFGDTLLVRNGGIEVQIPLRNVSHITFCSSSKPDRITLELAVPCELGKKIAFIPTPKGRLSSYGAAITENLKTSHSAKWRTVPPLMKQISRRWPDVSGSQKVLFYLWGTIAVSRLIAMSWGSPMKELGWHVLHAITVPGAILLLVTRETFFQPVVYDDGDALVVSKRNKQQVRIRFSNIRRVTYAGEGENQRVSLEFFEPCELGTSLRFQAGSKLGASKHSDIADDLHRRSRCCKEPDTHAQAPA